MAIRERSKKYDLITGDVLDEMERRLNERVEKSDGCWKWLGGTRMGYGCVYIPGHAPLSVYAHVLSFFLKEARWPAEGKMVCHTRNCSSKECVNPEHLYEGTAFTNAVDRYATRGGAAA